MERAANGIWHAHVSCEQAGFCPLVFRIDGAEVLNPLAPIGFGGSHPINYADIPNSEGAFYALGNVPHGTVAQNYYYSESTGTWKSCLVYLPPQYWCEPERRFPVLYLQHGHGENEQCWIHQGRANFILDNLIAEGKAQPMIVVMNNGMVQRDQDGCRILDFLTIEQLSCTPDETGVYHLGLSQYDAVFNTVPAPVFSSAQITLLRPDCPYIELASSPGGIAPNAAKPAAYIPAPGLPGKTAPKTAAAILFRAMCDSPYLSRQEVL